VAEKAVAAGLGVISITDHDTIAGLADADVACRDLGLQLIAGTEISAEVDGYEVHILGYDFDAGHAGLGRLFESQHQRREDRFRVFVDTLRKAGIPVGRLEDSEPHDQGTVGRPHLARLIVDTGAAESMDDAFARYLVPGAPTFVPRSFPTGASVLETLHEAGGKAVLAHPGHYTSDSIVRRLVEWGLDGLEAVHPAHDDGLSTYYRNTSARFELFVTGGSDYHGWREEDETNLGKYTVRWPIW
jgi:hypothetical protein